MKHGPDIAGVASLIGDPARANILTALMGGAALTATELAIEAGITKQTASAHLSRLLEGQFLAVEKQGRHRYFRLADDQVATLLEQLMGMAERRGPTRVRPGPKEPAMRESRVCYDHLAGDMGIRLMDGLVGKGWIEVVDQAPRITDPGRSAVAAMNIDVAALERRKRPLCRACLDWSARRSHLAGSLGAALLQAIFDAGWAKREEGSRIVAFSPAGTRAFTALFEGTS
ncbi:MAG: ArsR/SmtB family transcription factor [Geminicoccaceae bacterium]